jgi:site-specific DNA-methyltransferase (adenine-specific)
MCDIKLICDDCFNIIGSIGRIDLVLIDPPYGTTPLIWDIPIDIEVFWNKILNVVPDTTPIIIFAQEPFASKLRMSNITNYRYDWYWQKERLTNVFQVKRRPGKTVENILVFYKKQCVYNPQKVNHVGKKVTNKIGDLARFSITQSGKSNARPLEYIDDGTRYPNEIIRINRDNQKSVKHPTQKPVELLQYLIRTYTNTGDTVLDMFMGSGSTGVACIREGRNFIGIEKDHEYFEIAKKRIYEEESNSKLF